VSLRSKVLTIVATVVATYGIVGYVIQSRILFPSFAQLEREEATEDLQRCVRAIEREIQQLGTSAGDYGAWDDTAQFIADQNVKYAEANLTATSLKGLGINLLCICSLQGKVVGSRTLDLNTQESIDIPGFPKDSFPETHALLRLKEPKDAVGGIAMTGKGPMLVASQPVSNNEREGPIRGAVIIGKLLDSDVIANLREQTQVQFEILPVPPAQPPAKLEPAAAGDIHTARVEIDDRRTDVLHVTTALSDLAGTPCLQIKAAIPREITAKGATAMRFANYSIVAVGLLVLFALLASLQWSVLGPMSRLTHHVVRVGKTDDLTTRLSMSTKDEIGILATEFDRMVERLAETRRRVVEQSYESGLAEMASGTLHNVRNALTPVLVEIDMLREELAKVPVDQLNMARQQLGEGSVSESRRQELNRFLDLASGRLVTVTQETYLKLDDVAVRAKQIEQFLSEQEVSSRADRPLEWVSVDELTREAASLLPGELRERVTIEMGSGVAATGAFKTHRVCLLQVFGNLLTNAAEAIGSVGKDRGTVTVDACAEDEGGTAMIHLRVRDDGVGIAEQDLNRVFERGFTTKSGSARGMGLHWCANSVAAMNGRMYAESDGTGQGACMHVLLPRNA